MRCDFGHSGDVDMQDERTLDIEDMGAVTLATCQVRTAQCVAAHALDVVVVRILRRTTGDQAIRACAACREAMVGAGHWRLIPRSARAAFEPLSSDHGLPWR
mgnify:CR=1 FL=1